MSDYISREAAIAYAVSGRIRTLPTTEDGENWIRVNEVRESLKSVPAADVVERQKGKWEKIRDSYCAWSCSVCKEIVIAMPEQMGRPLYDYCPNCGADMRGES